MPRNILYAIGFIAFFIMHGIIGYAQSDNRIVCTSLVKKDSIVLRWAPASLTAWQVGTKYGYKIDRYLIAKDGALVPDGLNNALNLTPEAIKPTSKDQFELLSKRDSMASIVQGVLYDESVPVNSDENFFAFMKDYKEKEVRFGFALFACDLSVQVARATGLLYSDKKIIQGERYAYKIYPTHLPEGIVIEPAVIVIDTKEITQLPKVQDIQSLFMDKAVKLKWPIDIHKGIYTTYKVEKSEDGINFKSVSRLPLVNLGEQDELNYFVHTDSVKNNIKYWYRVKGVSPFGEVGPDSDVIKGIASPEFTAYAVIDTAEVKNNAQVNVRWRVSDPHQVVKGIIISRANDSKGIYKKLTTQTLKPTATMYEDTKPEVNNYYKITLLGDNAQSESFPYLVQTADDVPPQAPINLSGKVDSTGVVYLLWQANKEPDLLGYRVFRANARKEEFVSVDHDYIPINQFTDTITIKTLTSKIYYQVIAVDKRYNQSDFSSVLELKRPDIIPPAPALITGIRTEKGKVYIQTEYSPSEDVKLYQVYRRKENDSLDIKIGEWKLLHALIEDVPDKQGVRYTYTIKTIDESDNSSTNTRTVFLPVTNGNKIKIKLSQTEANAIRLQWQNPKDVKSISIYKGKAPNEISLYETINEAASEFVDTDVQEEETYTYCIRIYTTTKSIIISENETFKIKPIER